MCQHYEISGTLKNTLMDYYKRTDTYWNTCY